MAAVGRDIVLGYLRHYRRWNGTPGLTLAEQRALVRKVARATWPDCEKWRFEMEELFGEEFGWPVLKKVIQRAKDDAFLGLLAVIPTLDGVQFNWSFLRLLADPECVDEPIRVHSAWRRVGVMDKGTDYQYRPKHNFWQFNFPGQWAAFSEMADRVRQRNEALSDSIQIGLRNAAARGVKLGAHRRGAHRFTRAERREGGSTTALNRQEAANAPYEKWIWDMCSWRKQGWSIGEITMQLADEGARTPDGRKIGPMLVYRILKRALPEMEREGRV